MSEENTNEAGAGHNSGDDDGVAKLPESTLNVAGERLRSFIERYERLDEEKQTLMEDMKEVLSEAKGEGLDVKTIRQIIKIRKMDAADRQESESILECYMAALGLI